MHRKLLKLSTVFFSMIKCVLRAHRQEIWIGRGFGFFHAYSREMNSVKIETLTEIGFRSRLSRLFLLHKSPICWLGSVLFVDEGWVQFGGSIRRCLDTPQLPDWRLTPHHRHSPKKTELGWHSYASRQSVAHQLRRQNLQCSWTSSCLELSADGPQTAWLVIEPFQTVAEDFYLVSESKAQCESPFNGANLLT